MKYADALKKERPRRLGRQIYVEMLNYLGGNRKYVNTLIKYSLENPEEICDILNLKKSNPEIDLEKVKLTLDHLKKLSWIKIPLLYFY